MLLKYQLDWIKIVDFLLMGNFLACLLFLPTLYITFFLSAKDVYAIGDCAVNPQKPLPMIAQAAKQQAVYLGKNH